MSEYNFSAYADDAKRYTLRTLVPRIIVGGVCGAGKSSLLNALVRGKAFETAPSQPCTRENDESQLGDGDGKICFMDSPGFSEADTESADYAGRIRRLIASQAHLFILVIGAPNRSFDVESEWLRVARSETFFASVPGLVAINKIDMLPPIRDWKPDRLNLKNPTTEKERNIADYCRYICELKEFRAFAAQGRIVPVSAGESFDDPAQFNIPALRQIIFDLLPELAKVEFGRQTFMLNASAEIVVDRYATASAAGVFINPVGLGSDAAIIIPMQVRMIMKLAKIFGQEITWTAASSFLGPILTTLAGKTIFGTVALLIPGLKNIAGAPIAYALTKVLGSTVIDIFSSKQGSASESEIRQFAEKHAHSMDKEASQCPPPDVLKDKGSLN